MKHVPLLVALAALGIAIAAFVRVEDPTNFSAFPGKGLEAYDMSTPQAAWKAQTEIQVAGDMQAMMELSLVQTEERRRTARIEEVVEIDDSRVVLFIAREEDGKPKFSTQGMKLVPEQDIWLPDFISSYGLKKENEALAKKMRAWEGRTK